MHRLFISTLTSLFASTLILASVASASKLKAGDLSHLRLLDKKLRLACDTRTYSVGTIRPYRLRAGSVFKPFPLAKRIRADQKAMKKLKRLLSRARGGQRLVLTQRKKKLSKELKRFLSVRARCSSSSQGWENLNLGFTGIDLSVHGKKNRDYAYERLWHDTLSDDDAVIYARSDAVSFKFSHNKNNLKGGGLLASTASLKNRDLARGLQAQETILVEVKEEIQAIKRNELNFNIKVSEQPAAFDLTIDDLDTEGEDEHFYGLTLDSVISVQSRLVNLRYTGNSLKRPIDLPRQQEQRIHSGDILYRVDGDELRNPSRYDYASTPVDGGTPNSPSPTSPTFERMFKDSEIDFFRYTEPFSLSGFKGRTGDNGKALYDQDRIHHGLVDEYGDEWHTLTFWDNDWSTNFDVDRRDDAGSDAKIVYIVLDPKTPALSLEAPEGEEYYTTPPKTYYTPHIFNQTTFLTRGVRIVLTNVTNAEPIFYRVNTGEWKLYSDPLLAGAVFPLADTRYQFQYRNGSQGPARTRVIHFEPKQPARNETHPRLRFPNKDAIAAEYAATHSPGSEWTAAYNHRLKYYVQQNPIDFRSGIRSLKYKEMTGYFYQPKTLGGAVEDFAYFGVLENSDEYLKKAKDGLLFLYTIDAVGCESGKGRMGGPSQERCMYSDGRAILGSPVAYDLIFGYTRENGYPNGMTPIEHIKIRDNLASEAAILMKYPQTMPDNFWTNTRYADNTVRNLQLEVTFTEIAMAMPSYDSEYYGTSGADGVTLPSHYFAPFPDTPLTWSDLHFKEFVQHPHRPDLFRDSVLAGLYAPDGAYVGTTRCGYDQMMYQDLIPFMYVRRNFDGFHYGRLENNLRLEISGRDPSSGRQLPDCVTDGAPGRAFMLHEIPRLINKGFADAPLYLWAKADPAAVKSSIDYLADPEITPSPPAASSEVSPNYAIFAGNRSDPNTVFFRSRVLSSPVPQEGGTALQYLAGDFNLIAFGERLAIDIGGYGTGDWSKSRAQNVIEIDGQSDYNYTQVRGMFESQHLSAQLDYARMRTDPALSSPSSSFVKKGVSQVRHVFFPDKRFILMVDELSSTTGAHDYRYILHGSSGGSTAPNAFLKDSLNDRVVWTKPSGVQLLAQFASDVELNSEDLTATDYYLAESNEHYVTARQSGTNVSFLTLLYPIPNGGGTPAVSRLSNQLADAIEIVSESERYLMTVNKDGSDLTYLGLETDGDIALISFDAHSQITSAALIQGTFLKYQGATILSGELAGDYFR